MKHPLQYLVYATLLAALATHAQLGQAKAASDLRCDRKTPVIYG